MQVVVLLSPFLISGEDAPVNELVDFIAAAQIAEQLEKESEDSLSSEEEKDQVFNDHFNYINWFDNSVVLLQFLLCSVFIHWYKL